MQTGINEIIKAEVAEVEQMAAQTPYTPTEAVPEADTQTEAEQQPNAVNWWEMMQAAKGDLTKDIPLPTPILSYLNTPLWTKGNFSVIAGAPGSRKTFLTTLLVSAYLHESEWGGFTSNHEGASGCKVLWIDTEQAEGHVYEVMRRVNRTLGADPHTNLQGVEFYCLRQFDAEQRKAMTLAAIENLAPSLVVIDGIADLMQDVNDPHESGEVRDMLLRISAEQQNHIVCVLHTNPFSDKMRGHMGSEVQRKAETVILTQTQGDYTSIDFQKVRGKQPQKFTFFVNVEALPELMETPKAIVAPNTDLAQMFGEIFGSSTRGMKRADLERAVFAKLQEVSPTATINTAKSKVKRAADDGYIIQNSVSKMYYANGVEDAESGQLIMPF